MRLFRCSGWCAVAICAGFVGCAALCPLRAQTADPQQASSANPQQQPTHGQILIERRGDEPALGGTLQNRSAPVAAATKPAEPTHAQEQASGPQLTDQDRAAVHITRYDLDIRLVPAGSQLMGRARLVVRNSGDTSLTHIALQISSSLRWMSATLQSSSGNIRLPIAQHRLDTDADHTGQASELILSLPTPLAPAASLTLDTFYEGKIEASGGRLERLGVLPSQALATDWDVITPEMTTLRGFGNVLWYPVAAPQLFLSDGSLVPAIGKMRLEEAEIPVHLRLSIEYNGEAPVAAYFCGRRRDLAALPDHEDVPVAFGSGIATTDFPAKAIGIRPLSLFVLPLRETLAAPLPAPGVMDPTKPHASSSRSLSMTNVASPSSASTGMPVLAIETNDDALRDALAASTERITPLLESWLGPHPLSALTVIDHPGQPFEDGPLLVAPLASLSKPDASPSLAHSLTHAWVQTGEPWMDEGLAEFFSLLWIEREKGRDAAVAQMDALTQPLLAADAVPSANQSASGNSSSSSSSQAQAVVGQPLVFASDEIFYRRKAAAVWWMLRDIAGEQPLQLALSAWRTQPSGPGRPEDRARAFEALLEKTSGKDLGWFFDDWVLHDRGLPDLSIVDVTPNRLPAGAGHDSGWLIAVTMRNRGAAAAEVPLVIRSGTFSLTKRIHIPGNSTVTHREVVANPPTEVVLNDGSTPEAGAAIHTRNVVIHSD